MQRYIKNEGIFNVHADNSSEITEKKKVKSTTKYYK